MNASKRMADGSSLGLGCDHIGQGFVLLLKEFRIDSIQFLLDFFFMCRLIGLAFEFVLEDWQRLNILYRVGSFVLGYFDL